MHGQILVLKSPSVDSNKLDAKIYGMKVSVNQKILWSENLTVNLNLVYAKS